MDINPKHLSIDFDKAGVRDSRNRLKAMISELAVDPLLEYQDDLRGEFEYVESAVMKRIAAVVGYWCQHKHDPVRPGIDDLMSDITNARRSDESLGTFYIDQVKDAMHQLAPTLGLDVPDDYEVDTYDLEFALLELEERFEHAGASLAALKTSAAQERTFDAEAESIPPVVQEDTTAGDDWDALYDLDEEDENIASLGRWMENGNHNANDRANVQEKAPDEEQPAKEKPLNAQKQAEPQHETDIVVTQQELAEEPPKEINIDVLSISADESWQLIYNLMGYRSDYIQEKMLPRWQQNPDTFENDRRFLYNVFIQAIRNATGSQYVAGNFSFANREMTVDQLWDYYFTDLSQNVGPQLSVARLEAGVSAPWHKRLRRFLLKEMQRFSPIWMLALVIALTFDALTTFVSLDQTPMDGTMVWVFTVLITALFQIADMLVINYRKREFESDALIAKYTAKVEQLSRTLDTLEPTSASYVQLSMERSQANADLKAAEDNRKLSRRGRYWSARIADINIVVTAYGFAYLFLNNEEPMYALVEQIDFIFVQRAWASVNLWVFLMVGLAITVSFVINTAQRTEILGWSMRRLKSE